MRFRKASATAALLGVLAFAPGCKDFFDVNTSPLNPSKATNAQILPVIQVGMFTYLGFNIQGYGSYAASLVGQLNNTRDIGAYRSDPNALSNTWSGTFNDVLANNEIIIKQATASQDWGYLGIAQIQKAYVYSQLVDAYGDVPYSEALKGAALLNPRFDADVDIYNGNEALGIQGLFSLINEGIGNLRKPGASLVGGGDIIYQGNLTSWANFGRSLKLKLFNQIRKTNPAGLADSVQRLLGQPLLQPMATANFQLKFGTSTAPENRHIGFQSDYVNVGRENTVGPSLLTLLANGTTNYTLDPLPAASLDPRANYYVYNQAAATTGITGLYERTFAGMPGAFITTLRGGNGATNISSTQTLPGLYPYAGRYNDAPSNANENSAPGNGTQRLLTYFTQKFTEAELQLMVLNNPTAADAAYREGVLAAFEEVRRIATASDYAQANVPALGAAPASILDKVANATSTQDKLRVIMEQKYLASFGMGLDVYTDFRRTHYPLVVVPSASQIPAYYADGLVGAGLSGQGIYPSKFFYPQQDLTANLNPTTPKVNILAGQPGYKRIFWDL